MPGILPTKLCAVFILAVLAKAMAQGTISKGIFLKLISCHSLRLHNSVRDSVKNSSTIPILTNVFLIYFLESWGMPFLSYISMIHLLFIGECVFFFSRGGVIHQFGEGGFKLELFFFEKVLLPVRLQLYPCDRDMQRTGMFGGALVPPKCVRWLQVSEQQTNFL